MLLPVTTLSAHFSFAFFIFFFKPFIEETARSLGLLWSGLPRQGMMALLKAGANPNITMCGGYTPLRGMASYEHDTKA